MLYAVLLVNIVLIVSLSLFDISYRQIVLSSTVEASQFAFFAADSTRDCIRYWDSYYLYLSPPDKTQNFFGYVESSPPSLVAPADPLPADVICGDDSTGYSTASYYNDGSSTLTFDYGDGTQVTVNIIKIADSDPDPLIDNSVDEYVTTGTNIPGPSPRKVEATVRSVYK